MNEKRKDFMAVFQKANSDMVAANTEAYKGEWSYRQKTQRLKDYSSEEVDKIINSGSLNAQQQLSRNYFEKDGFYRRLIIYYANLYLYYSILIPNPVTNNLSKNNVQKRYNNAINFIEKVNLKGIFQHCAKEALINGTYYGVIQTVDKNNLTILDLPASYCCSRYKTKENVDLVEFDVRFFNTITDKDLRDVTLEVYPKKISDWYDKYSHGKVSSPWVFVPSDTGICFKMYDGVPTFLNVIPSTIQYDQAVDTEMARDKEEIRKIIVNKIGHLSDGTLLFEPDEVAVMHQGLVKMLNDNPNVSVMTTYGDVDSVTSKTASDSATSNLEKMMKNIYYEAGASSDIFSASSNLAIDTSIKNDMMLMAPLINKFENFVERMVNNFFGNTTLRFSYSILPITAYNQKDYVNLMFTLANGGYSWLLPAIASGIPQGSLKGLKYLENDILDLEKELIPLSSAYTGGANIQTTENKVGAPEKDNDKKADKTEQNQISLEKQGE